MDLRTAVEMTGERNAWTRSHLGVAFLSAMRSSTSARMSR